MNYTRYRAILNRYKPNNFPDTEVISGVICETEAEAKRRSLAIIQHVFDNRYTINLCPGRGVDPRFYEMNVTEHPVIWYKHPGSDELEPLFNSTYATVECTFSGTTNVIEYRMMRINKYLDKWYVSSKFNNQIVGIIDDKQSLNDICAEADKIWESINPNHQEPHITLNDN